MTTQLIISTPVHHSTNQLYSCTPLNSSSLLLYTTQLIISTPVHNSTHQLYSCTPPNSPAPLLYTTQLISSTHQFAKRVFVDYLLVLIRTRLRVVTAAGVVCAHPHPPPGIPPRRRWRFPVEVSPCRQPLSGCRWAAGPVRRGLRTALSVGNRIRLVVGVFPRDALRGDDECPAVGLLRGIAHGSFLVGTVAVGSDTSRSCGGDNCRLVGLRGGYRVG